MKNTNEVSSPRLTRREVEALTLIAEDIPTKEAAAALFISKRSVDFHLQNVYEKLGAHNRVQAIREATRRGLLTMGKGGQR